MYKLLLCWRYLRTRYIALASIISVMLGVATMIVVNAVMEGFTHEMQNRIHGILRANIAIAAVLLAAMAMIAAAAETAPGREANYIGAGTTHHGLNEHWIPTCELVFGVGDCPSPVPSGVGAASCDDESLHGSGIQGIGSVYFCGVPLHSQILIQIEDENVATVYAQVFCRLNESWNHLFDVHGSGTGEVPLMCSLSSGSDGTRLHVRLHLPPAGEGATRGTVYLTFLGT
jgi:hypothetical protein